MRVLVLGAGGFVGTRVTQALAAAAWADPVRGQRRPAPGAVVVDTLKADDLARALDGVDAVVNCVAGSAEAIGQGAGALFAAAGGRRVVHLSSMAVYGDAVGDVTEDRPFARGHGAYGDAKIAAEEAAAGRDAVILRPGCIYGPGSAQWTWRLARLLATGRLGDLGANGDGCSNLVHVDDVAAAVLAGLRLPGVATRAYNLAMANAPDWNAYLIAFARALGAVPVRRIGARRLKIETKLLAPPLKIAEIVAGKAGRGEAVPPPIPPSLARLFRQDIRLVSDRAEAELGVRWTPLQEGLAVAADWVRRRMTASA